MCCRQRTLIRRGLLLYMNAHSCVHKLIIVAASSHLARDVALYALGIGACSRDAVDADELKYVHHKKGLECIQVEFSLMYVGSCLNF